MLDDILRMRVPSEIKEAIEAAADLRLESASQFMRMAVVLRAVGVLAEKLKLLKYERNQDGERIWPPEALKPWVDQGFSIELAEELALREHQRLLGLLVVLDGDALSHGRTPELPDGAVIGFMQTENGHWRRTAMVRNESGEFVPVESSLDADVEQTMSMSMDEEPSGVG